MHMGMPLAPTMAGYPVTTDTGYRNVRRPLQSTHLTLALSVHMCLTLTLHIGLLLYQVTWQTRGNGPTPTNNISQLGLALAMSHTLPPLNHIVLRFGLVSCPLY